MTGEQLVGKDVEGSDGCPKRCWLLARHLHEGA